MRWTSPPNGKAYPMLSWFRAVWWCARPLPIEHPEALKAFLKEYASSAEYAVNSPADAGTLVEKYGIMASAALAEKAIPNCNIVCITGEEMQVMVSGMLKVLFDANPKSVGGKTAPVTRCSMSDNT